MVEKDTAAGRLVAMDVDDVPRSGVMLTMSAYHQPSQRSGPAGRWFIDRLKTSWELKAEARKRPARAAGRS